MLHGIKLGGRALHSAKVLLGLAAATGARKRGAKTAAKMNHGKAPAIKRKTNPTTLEDQVMLAITQIQDAATDQTRRLREAVREAVRILERALDD